jgi:hypothetical protein
MARPLGREGGLVSESANQNHYINYSAYIAESQEKQGLQSPSPSLYWVVFHQPHNSIRIFRSVSMTKLYDSYLPEEIYNKEVLGEETIEEQIERLKRSLKYGIVCRTIISGEMLESEIYPCFSKKDIPRRDKEKPSREAQQNLNDKNAKKKIKRLIHTNFKFREDLIVDPSYEDHYLPTEAEAKKDMINFIRRLKRARKKLGLSPLKYIYVIGYEEEGKKTKRIRIHHHMVINDMDRDLVESLWGKGRIQTRRLQPDDFGVEGRATYMINHMAKQSKGAKRWFASRNLKQPRVYKSFTKLSKRKMEQLARKEIDWEETFEKLYKEKYKYSDCKMYESEITGGFYLYCRMRRRD